MVFWLIFGLMHGFVVYFYVDVMIDTVEVFMLASAIV